MKRTCNKDDITILARACARVCACARACLCQCVRLCVSVSVSVRACACEHEEREAYVPASVPREATLSVSFIFITTDTTEMRGVRACVRVCVYQALETPRSSYKFIYFFYI